MRIRTVFAAAAIAALTILGSAGAASANDDDYDGHGGDVNTHVAQNAVTGFGDLVMD
ncbi:hypothetical protein ACFVYR_18530 [Streptomyces sp. NPDC058284]|uniref:hypothetical protein n=1 Tax=unclassified Streptomyces TaxID=2593676 RepID=UPI0036593848